MPSRLALLVVLCFGLGSLGAEPPAKLHPFNLLGKNLSDSFWGKTTFFHLGAFASTVVMVKTPADRTIQDYFIRETPLGHDFGFAMLRAGDATSFVLGLAFYGVGLYYNSPKLTAAGAAALQAVMINGAYVGALKVITARYRPGEHNSADDFFPSWDERVDNFRFRTDYPSGHTSTSFAFVATMHSFYREQKWIPWVGYPLAGLIGIGMVAGRYHWTSDVIAGAIIGTTIGYTTGSNFRDEYERRNKESEAEPTSKSAQKAPAFMLSPVVGSGNYSLAMTWYW